MVLKVNLRYMYAFAIKPEDKDNRDFKRLALALTEISQQVTQSEDGEWSFMTYTPLETKEEVLEFAASAWADKTCDFTFRRFA